MYIELHSNPIINEIMCIPFENLRLNDNTYEKCVQTFKNDIPDDAIIVYSPSEEGIVVLGYFVLDDANMVTSKYYESLRSATMCFEDVDETDYIREIECVHIKTWLFDNSLRNEIYLPKILTSIIINCITNNKGFLWYDNLQGELCFYPIDNKHLFGNVAALSHFKDDFLKQ